MIRNVLGGVVRQIRFCFQMTITLKSMSSHTDDGIRPVIFKCEAMSNTENE
jgi:hypothetical protein